MRCRSSRPRSAVLAVLSVLAAVVALAVGAPAATAAGSLPCDVYAAAGTPCVAAHSLVRALYSSYNGSLYQVQRASDSATANIGLLAAGGYANAAAQDSFCSGTTCIITKILSQSARATTTSPSRARAGRARPTSGARGTRCR